jgi:hypothetical protein
MAIDTARIIPSNINIVASVTMKDGSSVLTTINPFSSPSPTARTPAAAIPTQAESPNQPVAIATDIEVAPTMAPTDKSNSPAIINIPTGIAAIPNSDAVPSQFAVPSELRKPFRPAMLAKKAKTKIAATTPPVSGRATKRRVINPRSFLLEELPEEIFVLGVITLPVSRFVVI